MVAARVIVDCGGSAQSVRRSRHIGSKGHAFGVSKIFPPLTRS
jgi:hypothetical protein